MKIIPAMDIIDNQVVRLTQGDYAQKQVYDTDPIGLAKRFQDNGVERLHLVDLSGAKKGEPVHFELFAKIKKETGLMIEAGGGVRKLEHVESLFSSLDIHSDFVMIGSLPFKNQEEFSKIVAAYAKNILITIDVWGYSIKISGWQEDTKVELGKALKDFTSRGLENFLVTQIKKDGMMLGPDFELYKEIMAEFSVRLIASGGVSSVEDLKQLNEIENLYGAVLGRAFYENEVSLADVKSLSASFGT